MQEMVGQGYRSFSSRNPNFTWPKTILPEVLSSSTKALVKGLNGLGTGYSKPFNSNRYEHNPDRRHSGLSAVKRT
jgi:hypothetical protein